VVVTYADRTQIAFATREEAETSAFHAADATASNGHAVSVLIMPEGSTFLTMDQVRDVDGLAHMAKREGLDLNLCITVRAPKGLSDAAGKRAIDGRLKHIGQALRERGQVWLAVWV
jgi:hypothetical protein